MKNKRSTNRCGHSRTPGTGFKRASMETFPVYVQNMLCDISIFVNSKEYVNKRRTNLMLTDVATREHQAPVPHWPFWGLHSSKEYSRDTTRKVSKEFLYSSMDCSKDSFSKLPRQSFRYLSEIYPGNPSLIPSKKKPIQLILHIFLQEFLQRIL